MSEHRKRFYRDKLNGNLFGVFAGIDNYIGFSAVWLRLGFIVATFMTGGALVPIYFIVAMITPSKPPFLYNDQADGPRPANRKDLDQ